MQNGDETDVDCGGVCPPCPDGSGCLDPSDCESSVCGAMLCQAPACDDGVRNGDETDVDCGGACAPCPDGSMCGSDADCDGGRCVDGVCDTAPEICGNCLDDDGNGLIDAEDPACCGVPFTGTRQRGKLRPRGDGTTKLKLKPSLAASGLAVDPPSEEVSLVIRSAEEPEVFCATIPQGGFVRKGKKFRFRDKKGQVPEANGLTKIVVREKKSGELRFISVGKRVPYPFGSSSDATERSVTMTVGFRAPSDAAEASRCSTITNGFRRKGKAYRAIK